MKKVIRWPELGKLQSGRATALCFFVALLISGIAQLFLGASFVNVAMVLISGAIGVGLFVYLGPFTLGAWLALFYVLGNVVVGLFSKTFLGQPIDSNLYAPTESFFVVVLSTSALALAALLVRKVAVGNPLFSPDVPVKTLSRASWACFLLGCVLWLVNSVLASADGPGFGGLAVLRDVLLMAVICRTAFLLKSSGGTRTWDAALIAMVGTGVALGLLDNVKTLAALPVISYYATVVFFRRPLSAGSFAFLLVGGLVFVTAIAPAVHELRALGQQSMTLGERIIVLGRAAQSIWERPSSIGGMQRSAASQFESSYYNYFGGSGGSQVILGRYASIQQIDPVVSSASREGLQGGEALWPALVRMVPGFVYPDKPTDTEPFRTLVYYGLVDPSGGRFPTLPLAGQSFAAFGYLGAFLVPFVVFFLWLLAVKKFGANLCGNVFAIFIFCQFLFVYASQGDFGQYVAHTLRSLPMFTVIFIALIAVGRVNANRVTSSKRAQG